MILTKNNLFYTVLNVTENLKLEGRVFLEDGELRLDSLIYNIDGALIGVASYTYRNGGNCSKSIGDTKRIHILYIEQILENTISFLLERFNMQ